MLGKTYSAGKLSLGAGHQIVVKNGSLETHPVWAFKIIKGKRGGVRGGRHSTCEWRSIVCNGIPQAGSVGPYT